jgi:hypothetical protein
VPALSLALLPFLLFLWLGLGAGVASAEYSICMSELVTDRKLLLRPDSSAATVAAAAAGMGPPFD